MEAMPQFLQPDWTNNIAQLLSAYVHAHVCIYVNHRPNIGINIYSNGIYIIICIYNYIYIYICCLYLSFYIYLGHLPGLLSSLGKLDDMRHDDAHILSGEDFLQQH